MLMHFPETHAELAEDRKNCIKLNVNRQMKKTTPLKNALLKMKEQKPQCRTPVNINPEIK
jgi:hypothetical protein